MQQGGPFAGMNEISYVGYKGKMAHILDPSQIAGKFRKEVKEAVRHLSVPPRIVGFLSTQVGPAITYASYMKHGFEDIGIGFELREVPRLRLESEILAANSDSSVHGMFVYYPVFGGEQDVFVRNLVDFRKDIEALNFYWLKKLYANDRYAVAGDTTRKAILPCTSVGILKILSHLGLDDGPPGQPLQGHTVCLFNRSELVGRPLTVMLSYNGAAVYSFDKRGPIAYEQGAPSETDISRVEALEQSDIVITGVPDKAFEKIRDSEISRDAVCINFATIRNFEDDVKNVCGVFVPRVGPVTVAMSIRNAVRLYYNFHEPW